jgi:hypothetical protein
MTDNEKDANTEVEREERRLERLRLASVIALPQRDDEDDEPRPAA